MFYRSFSSIFLIFFLSFSVSAIEMKSEDFVSAVYNEVYKRVKNIKIEIPKDKKESINSGSRGSILIERVKQRNREKLAKMRGIDPRKVKSGSDIVKSQIQDNKSLLAHAKKLKKELEVIEKRVISNFEWKSRFKVIEKKWIDAKREFVKNIKI